MYLIKYIIFYNIKKYHSRYRLLFKKKTVIMEYKRLNYKQPLL